MDKENLVYIHNEVLFNIKKNKIMLFAGKWMELEIIMLSKISQTQKDKYHICSHTQNLNFLEDMKVEAIIFGKRKGTSRREERGHKRVWVV
jgi:hypothetical protein